MMIFRAYYIHPDGDIYSYDNVGWDSCGHFFAQREKNKFSLSAHYDRDVYGVDSSGGGNVTLSGGVDWDSYGYLTLRSSDLVSMFIMVRGKCTQMATLVGIHMMDIPTGG